MTSMRSPVSTGWGAIRRYSRFWRARTSCPPAAPANNAMTSSGSRPRMNVQVSLMRASLLARGALLARHGNDLVEHLEIALVVHGGLVGLEHHGRRHQVLAVDRERGGSGYVVGPRHLDRAHPAALDAEGVVGLGEIFSIDALLRHPVEQHFRIREPDLLLVDRVEHVVVQLVHYPHRLERVVGPGERYPRVGEHRRHPSELDIGGLLLEPDPQRGDRKSTRLNSSHSQISYAVFCLKKKNKT